MATDEIDSGESGYYANLASLRPSFLARQRLLTAEELRNLESVNDTPKPTTGNTYEKRIDAVKERIRGNMDQLDYLRGISNLERKFTSLIDQVLHTALTLSKENNVSHPQYVFDEHMEDKVERCWKYITQLTEAVQWHVMHASRYHKFYHDLRTAQNELAKLVSNINESTSLLPVSSGLFNYTRLKKIQDDIKSQLDKFTKLASTARQLCIQSRAVAPLHYRKCLPEGRHSANLLASIRLPSNEWLHRGDSVQVWTNNRISRDLLHEWSAETPDGTHSTTLPAACLWLTSPETSPLASVREHASRITVYTGERKRQRVDHAKEEEDATEVGPNEDTFNFDKVQHDRKEKVRGNLFCNNRALAAKFQTAVFSAWTDAIGDWASTLLPTYRAFTERLVKTEGDIMLTRVDDLGELKNELQPLFDYGDNELQTLFSELKLKPITQTAENTSISNKELLQMVQTLKAWNKLRNQLLEVKRNASVRSISHEAFTKLSHDSQKKRFQSFDARRVSDPRIDSSTQPVESTCLHSTDHEISQIDELVTSFAEPAPRTFRIVSDGKLQFIEPDSVSFHKETYTASVPDQSGQLHSSTYSKTETKDLMTQITTPYLPTVIHCPKCDLDYEVDLYRCPNEMSAATTLCMKADPYQIVSDDLLQYSPGSSHVGHRSSDLVQRDLSLHPGKVRSADSMPALDGTHDTKYVAPETLFSTRSYAADSGIKLRKRLGRWVKHRPHSFSTATATAVTPGATDTTASSGIDSLTDTPTMEESMKKSRRVPSKKHAERQRTKTTGLSIFRWGKKRKTTPESVSPATESVGTESGPPEPRSPSMSNQHSPLHVHTQLTHPDSVATLTDQDTPQPGLATPIIRSRSWVQHGTPWGYGPPLHEHWHPSTEYVISQERPQVRKSQLHSERLKPRASRPRFSSDKQFAATTSDRSFSIEYSPTCHFIDSGIQTDTDLAPGLSDLAAKGTNKLLIKGRQKFCTQCQTPIIQSPTVHAGVQCGASINEYMQTGVSVDLIKVKHTSTSCQVGLCDFPKREQLQYWDVCCQVGTVQLSKGIAVDEHQFVPENQIGIAKTETEGVFTQYPAQPKASVVDSFTCRSHHPPMYSVSCQVGQIVRTIASGPEHLEAVKMLDESIEKFTSSSSMQFESTKVQPVSAMVGKKLQVGRPWWDTVPSVEHKDVALSPIEIPDILQESNTLLLSSRKLPRNAPVDPNVHTSHSDDVIPYRPAAFESWVQTEPSENQSIICIKQETTKTEQKTPRKVNDSVMCLRSTWYIQPKPKMSSVSTLIGCQTASSEQQTDLQGTELEAAMIRVQQNAKLVQIQWAEQPTAHITQATFNPPTEAPIPVTSIDSGFLKPLSEPEPENSDAHLTVLTRSKRIQKGSPKLSYRSSNARGKQVNSQERDIPMTVHKLREESFPTQKYPLKYQPSHQRVVVDVGFYESPRTDFPLHKSSREHKYAEHPVVQSVDESTDSSTTDVDELMTYTRHNLPTRHPPHARCISVPSKSLRMCFHLDRPLEACITPHRYKNPKRLRSDVRTTQRSWSVDDIRAFRSGWKKTIYQENDERCMWIEHPNSARQPVAYYPTIEWTGAEAPRHSDYAKRRDFHQ